jgi:hypothetical protein
LGRINDVLQFLTFHEGLQTAGIIAIKKIVTK